jgi:hypothetical protein
MPALGRETKKLLRHVGGKKHARDEDHEEPVAKRRQSPILQKAQTEQDIHAEPASSDDEIREPPPRPSRPSELKIPASNGPKSNPTNGLNLPQRKSDRKQAGKQASPTKFAVESQAAKPRAGVGDDKENTSAATPMSSNTSGQDDIFGFGMAHASQHSDKSTKAKKTFAKPKSMNIHSQPPSKKPARQAIRVPGPSGKKGENARKDKVTPTEEDDESDVSMLSPEGLEDLLGSDKSQDPDLRTVDKKKRSKKKAQSSTSATMDDEELEAFLVDAPEDKELKRASRRSKPRILHDQLGDWMQDKVPGSSQPPSSAPQEDLDDLKVYLKQLPEEEEEGSTCPICRALVSQEDYWDYWKGKEKTVKNQNVFCRVHRTKSAWEDYRSEGYPDITWNTLPQRIQKHRMDLFKILNNERPSGYRDRYEPIALTGKAAAVPSRRKDLPEHVQEELESYAIDDQSTYPGYYGPHGRRIITETVMKVLKNEIKNCSDAVVQGSGPATFVQAVLVPETAILLIMEDCRVDREEAEEIREKTYDIGMLLNEEIEDQVEVRDISDDENEYGGR